MLSKKNKYLQIALNSSLAEARAIIFRLPASDRIILEAGTPLLKKEGAHAIRQIKSLWQSRLLGQSPQQKAATPKTLFASLKQLQQFQQFQHFKQASEASDLSPYIVADYKAMDRGATEVQIAAGAGAGAITVLGQAPPETINTLLKTAEKQNIDVIIDMMNVNQPYQVLRQLKRLPKVVMLHRGVDETERSDTPLPIHQINKVKGAFDVMIAVGGGDTIREVQSAFFNGANIVMVWKDFYEAKDNTAEIAEEFLKQVK